MFVNEICTDGAAGRREIWWDVMGCDAVMWCLSPAGCSVMLAVVVGGAAGISVSKKKTNKRQKSEINQIKRHVLLWVSCKRRVLFLFLKHWISVKWNRPKAVAWAMHHFSSAAKDLILSSSFHWSKDLPHPGTPHSLCVTTDKSVNPQTFTRNKGCSEKTLGRKRQESSLLRRTSLRTEMEINLNWKEDFNLITELSIMKQN